MSVSERKRVLLVDDVDIDVRKYRQALSFTGSFELTSVKSAAHAIEAARATAFDVAVLDLVMPPDGLEDFETAFGEETGFQLAAQLVRLQPSVKIVILSHANARESLEPGFREKLNISAMLTKRDTSGIELVRTLDRVLGIRSMDPSIFIVHGHDRDLVEFAKKAVKNELSADAIILDEQAGAALTIIEKFEKYAQAADAVIVLMSGDDIGSSRKMMSESQFRARQNVLFELGYFLGKFRRESGRVFILKKGELEIPTDLSGVGYIDCLDEADALMRLRREFQSTFSPLSILSRS